MKSPTNIEELLQKFEDELLSASHDNEGGVLVCEIYVFRKYAKEFLSQVRLSTLSEILEGIRGMEFEEPNQHETEVGRACHEEHNQTLAAIQSLLEKKLHE